MDQGRERWALDGTACTLLCGMLLWRADPEEEEKASSHSLTLFLAARANPVHFFALPRGNLGIKSIFHMSKDAQKMR